MADFCMILSMKLLKELAKMKEKRSLRSFTINQDSGYGLDHIKIYSLTLHQINT